MKKFVRAAAALLSAVLLCSCSGAQPKKPRLDVDHSPIAEKDCVTPPFWVVEDETTGAQIFLLGSMHAAPSGTKYPQYITEALLNSSWAAPEMDTIEFERDFLLQQKCVNYLMLNGTTMPELLGEDYDRTADYFRSKGILQPGMDYMEPFYWASAATALIMEETGLDSAFGTENQLLKLAHSNGIEIREIEGGESQYKMMGNIPMSVQLETLAECVGDERIKAQADATLELYEAWSRFDDEYFGGLTVFDPNEVQSPEDWQSYYDMMYTDRQRLMADFILDGVKKGEQGFVFVGALHYYAEPSIIDLLNESGCTVTPIRGTANEGLQAA